jgi:Drexlerviridae DNA repair exonuclease
MGLSEGQEAAWTLRQEGLTQQQIADELNISRRTVRSRLDRAAKKSDQDPAIQEAMNAFGLGIEPSQVWLKNKQFSVQVKPKKAAEVDFLERVKEAFLNLPAALEINRIGEIDTETMVVYPFFDVHLGLRAHKEISGEDMDLEKGVRRVIDAMASVMEGSPNAHRAVIINGGDFTHQTDDKNQTRKSGHILDVDGRNIMTVLEAVEVISTCIEMALTKHDVVEYYSVPGNHDPQNWETILIGLRERYRNNPRVTIDFRLNEFSIIEHGEVAIFIHHGDKRTPKDLSLFCAAEFPEVWGRTRYRILMTGHLHHLKVEEFPGIIWMQMEALAVRDHYSATGGFKSHASITALAFDRMSECSRVMRKL